MTGRMPLGLLSPAVAALLVAANAVGAGDEGKCAAKGWEYSHTEVRGERRIVHCKKPKAVSERDRLEKRQVEARAVREKIAEVARRHIGQRQAVLELAQRSGRPGGSPPVNGGDDSWEAFEQALYSPEGPAPPNPFRSIPLAAGVAAAAAAAWAWVYKNRRAISGSLIAIAAICAIVVLLKSPPPSMVAVASRLGLAGWIAGPTRVVTSDSRILRLEEHALRRIAERVTSLSEVRQAARMPPFPYFHQGVWKTGFWDPTTRIFVGSYNSVVTTVIANVKPQYIRNIMSRRP